MVLSANCLASSASQAQRTSRFLSFFALFKRSTSACKYRSIDANASGGVLPMNPGYTSVAICSRIDCKTLNIGRSALPDTALSTSAYRFKITITSCATAYTVSSNTSRTSSTAFANASSSGNSSTFGSKRFTAANCRSSVRSFVD